MNYVYVITPLHVQYPRPSGLVHVNQIMHKQGCVITNLFPVEAMLWQLRMHANDHEHADRINIGS